VALPFSVAFSFCPIYVDRFVVAADIERLEAIPFKAFQVKNRLKKPF
jgi:hypothetical protein